MNPSHLAVLQQGVASWNEWRSANPHIQPDLSGADLHGMDLRNADLRRCNLRQIQAGGDYSSMGGFLLGARFNESDLTEAYLRAAILRHSSFERSVLERANLTKADLYHVNFTRAVMHQIDLWGSSLTDCDASNSTLTQARMRGTSLIRTNLRSCNLTGSLVYGCSVWDVDLTNSIQQDLIITPSDERQRWRGTSGGKLRPPVITVDNLEIAQLVYLLLHNDKIRNVIDTIGQRGVLILGRFTADRKPILDSLRVRLREMGFLPLMFDFERPSQRDFTETISILAGLSLFIIADITNPKSSPLELQVTMPHYMVPLVPIIEYGEEPFSMFSDLGHKYRDWVLDVLEYDTLDNLLNVFASAVVEPALARSRQLVLRRAETLCARHVRDYLPGPSNPSLQRTRFARR